MNRGRVGAALGLLAMTCAFAGCTVTEDAYQQAEEGVAIGTDDVATRYSQLAFEPSSSVTAESLAGIALYVFLEPPEYGTTPALPYGTTIYALDEGSEVSSVRVFVVSGASVTSALSTSSSTMYGCAILSADHDTQTVAITDEQCPAWLAAWPGSDALQVSLADVTKDETGKTEW